MTSDRPRRAMWLLHHPSARAFEIPMLKRVGFTEIFQPKIIPERVLRSANVDFSEDANLTIPDEDLARLNATDWYSPVPRDTWDIVNKHFDVLFFVIYDDQVVDAIETMARRFRGVALWRAYGLDDPHSYSKLVERHHTLRLLLEQRSARFFLASAYEGIAAFEQPWLADRTVYLPLGLANDVLDDRWNGRDARVLFICPEIRFSAYYQRIYENFRKNFGDLPYLIGGAQPIAVDDPNAAGFIHPEEYDRTMRELRVMFYHSSEPRHVHYHPFEAIKAGMPLVYMGGGLLEQLAGRKLPGQAESIADARRKLERILDGDKKLIDAVRDSQTVLLAAMSAKGAEPHWQKNFDRIRADANERRLPTIKTARRRVAVIVPAPYRGGTMRAAKLTAAALLLGSRQYSEDADIVLAHLNHPGIYAEDEFDDLIEGIKLRPFHWTRLDQDHARNAMILAGHATWSPDAASFMVPDDGINNLLDCDVWLIISDQIPGHILPIRPCIHLIFDCIQRYVNFMSEETVQLRLATAFKADQVLVTTEFTRQDILRYVGLPPKRVVKVPMLGPLFRPSPGHAKATGYFIWTTNAAQHKNQERALQALAIYYGELAGTLKCRVTGVDTERLFDGDQPHLAAARKLHRSEPVLRKEVTFFGELPDREYRRMLAGATFLWHPALVDNGTSSVIEAASLGVPSLSSDYPPMRELDRQFSLGLTFAESTNSRRMAEALQRMERDIEQARAALPTRQMLEKQSLTALAGPYWARLREWL